MPELPEVETVRRGLCALLKLPVTVESVRFFRKDLRSPMPSDLPTRSKGAELTAIRRRAKYLLWDTSAGTWLNHLGMTGSWRLREADEDYGTPTISLLA